MTQSAEYSAWSAARQRCHNPGHPCYKWYGARGIGMDEQWRSDFQVFLDSMGRMPSPGLTLERINANAGYVPGNCVWATPAVQARNTRRNVFIKRNGKQYVFVDLIRALGLKTSTPINRKSRGWPESRWFEPFTVEEAIAAFEAQSEAQPT